MLVAPGRWPLNKKFGPAISEAAEPRYASVCAVKLPYTSRRSKGRPRYELGLVKASVVIRQSSARSCALFGRRFSIDLNSRHFYSGISGAECPGIFKLANNLWLFQ
jgi:hypothetical protein